MVKPGPRIALCLLVTLIAAVAPSIAPRAEVSADTDQSVNLLILGITEGPDPIPQVIWTPVREDVDPVLFLNVEGASRGDGRPDASFHQQTSEPRVVWAYYFNQSHYNIAYSSWNGSAWKEPEFLTSGDSDDLDPRIFIGPDGTEYVVWWEFGIERVWMSMRPTGLANWSEFEPVTGLIDSGRRPTVVVSGGVVRAAYERDGAPSGQEVVVATRIGQGVYDLDAIALSPSDSALNVILHHERDKLWCDWRHSDSTFAYSVYQGNHWSDPVTLPWTDGSWTRDAEARRVIRNIVLSEAGQK